jgi:hypothetical protein
MAISDRDYFAARETATPMFKTLEQAAAFIGLKPEEFDHVTHWPHVVAKHRFQMADAMLAARDGAKVEPFVKPADPAPEAPNA